MNQSMYYCLLLFSHFSSVQLFCSPMDCSLQGFSLHGILEARILECVAISFFRVSSQPRNQTCVSCIGRKTLYHREPPGKPTYHCSSIWIYFITQALGTVLHLEWMNCNFQPSKALHCEKLTLATNDSFSTLIRRKKKIPSYGPAYCLKYTLEFFWLGVKLL